jgi:hypothetical protein
MSRLTKQNLTLADRMAEAGIEPFWVNQVRQMLRGYISLRLTCRLLHKDNMALRAKLGLPQLGEKDEGKT